MRRSSYLLRQLVVLVAAVSAPLLLLLGWNLHQQYRQANDDARQAVANYASSVAQDADTLIADTGQYLAFVAVRPQIRALDPDRCDPLLEGVTRRRRHVANVLVADAQGRPVCLSLRGPGEVPQTLTTFDWYRHASSSDAMTLSKPFFAPIVRKWVVAASLPLRDTGQTRIGSVTVLLDLESLQHQWGRYALPPDSRITLFDAEGTIIVTRPDLPSLVGKDASATLRNARALNEGDVGIAPGVDGLERAFALKPVDSAGWHAAAAIPTQHVFGPASALLRRSLVVATLVIAAVFTIAFVMARRMVRPLRGLVEVARAVGQGQTDRRASEAVPGEFREVAREFNLMLDRNDRHVDFYKALSRTNGAIVRSTDAQSLYEEICRICVEHGHASIAYVSLVAGAEMQHVAWAGPAEGFVQALDVRPGDAGIARSGLSGLAAFKGTRQISNDVYEDPRTVPWRQLGAEIGTRSIASFPFTRDSTTVGTLTLHMTVPGFFDDRVNALLEEMAEDISFALDNFVRKDALAREQRKLSGLVDTAMDAIISIDASHQIRLINRSACEMFQVRPEEALGTGIQRFIPHRLQHVHEGHLRQFAHTGSTARRMGTHNLVAVRADGSEFPIDASISKLGEGESAFMTVVIRDATELRQAQHARLAQVAAEAASRAKTDFLSRMSHELRTPLNAVLGFSQLLQAGPAHSLTSMQQQYVGQIRAAGWHLLALINDVLDVSKIEGGHVALQEQSVHVQEVLDEAVRIIQPTADAAGTGIIASYREVGATSVLADPQRLRQVMINLISNAIKYNRPGGTVEVRCTADADTTHVDVIDTGIGMTPDQLAHLFEPFNRLGREQGNIEGTGLGLTLARHLAQLMRGTLEVDSTFGTGTRARLALRTQMNAQPPPPPPPPQPDATHQSDGDAVPGGTVLYVEDNPVNYMLVEHLLLQWRDVTLLQAETGGAGLSVARSVPIDLILLDMRLPDMDGLQILRELHAHPATRDIRVIALSASAMPEDVDAALAAGALHYWTKPLDFSQFIRDMKALLAGSRPS